MFDIYEVQTWPMWLRKIYVYTWPVSFFAWFILFITGWIVLLPFFLMVIAWSHWRDSIKPLLQNRQDNHDDD